VHPRSKDHAAHARPSSLQGRATFLPVTTHAIKTTDVRFPALDGYELGGTLFEPAGDEAPKHAVVFNCGGGVPAARYRRFASYLASRGIAVFTYDYRGIGASRPATLKRFAATIEDWSESDSGGAIAWMVSKYPTSELVGVAHSVGGMLLAAAPNAGQISRFVLVGVHTGYFGDYRAGFRLPMAIVWHAFMPTITRVVGYFPSSWFRLGHDIPSGVAMQWAQRRSPDLTGAGERADAGLRRCANLRGKALVMSASDDAFATRAGTQRLLSYVPGLAAEIHSLRPNEVGMKRIGHFGFFRRGAEVRIWPIAARWIAGGTVNAARA
jgi:predicted alpha/beta hydrolase